MAQLVRADYALHLRREAVVEEDEAVALYHPVHALHAAEIRAEQHLDAQLPGHLKGIARAAAAGRASRRPRITASRSCLVRAFLRPYFLFFSLLSSTLAERAHGPVHGVVAERAAREHARDLAHQRVDVPRGLRPAALVRLDYERPGAAEQVLRRGAERVGYCAARRPCWRAGASPIRSSVSCARSRPPSRPGRPASARTARASL